MSILDTLRKLITAIKSDKFVARYKELEKMIDSDELLMSEYKNLLNLQKLMVQHEVKKSSKYTESKSNYDDQYSKVMNHYLMAEYLDVLEVVNNDLQLIKGIILNELSADFE